jgi:hypothetical protein
MAHNTDIEYQQKLLSMYRSLLAEYLRQRDLWHRTEIPVFLSRGISVIRGHIVDVKGRLRGWKVAIVDHPDDEGSEDNLALEIAGYRDLLKIHRRNLEVYLEQLEQFGEGLAPPVVIHSIQDNRSEIQHIKAILRGWNITVEDLPGEDEELRT